MLPERPISHQVLDDGLATDGLTRDQTHIRQGRKRTAETFFLKHGTDLARQTINPACIGAFQTHQESEESRLATAQKAHDDVV
jgi:hypothetical protein